MRYERIPIRQIQQYNDLFIPQRQGKNVPPRPSDLKQALDQALKTRQFEIDLYWKRATYFWAFIAAAFAGYFALYSSTEIQYFEKHEGMLIVTCIGLVFSCAWFLANRGSKFWQENWEKHVDMLEDHVYGPLYKTTLDNQQFSPFGITQPFQYSVSKINQVLSFFVSLIWFVLVCREISYLIRLQERFPWLNEVSVGIITIGILLYLFFGTRGGTSNRPFFFETREVRD